MIRADNTTIHVGARSNVQEGAMLKVLAAHHVARARAYAAGLLPVA